MARTAKLAVAAVLVALMVAAPVVRAVTCSQAVSSLSPCIGYLSGKDPTTSRACCNGVVDLNAAASSTVDRRTICTCLKQQTSGMEGLQLNLVADLPGQFRVNIPYKISPSID